MGWSSQAVVASQVIVEGSEDGVFVYAGTPGSGNLIVSLAAAAGVDPYGNSFPQGMNVTAGEIDGTTLNAAVIKAGAISAGSIGGSTLADCDVQGGTAENTVITFDSSGGSLLVYSTTTTTTTFTSSGTFTVPAGVTSLALECWGAGAGGAGGGLAGGANSGGYGGGGGAYAKVTAAAVTAGNSYAVTVGAGGASGAVNGLGGNGGASSFDAMCIAAGGMAANAAHRGLGGAAASSTGDVRFDGGDGGDATGSGGSGGGASAGASSNGNDGQSVTGSSGGSGGAGITNSSGSGGAGGNSNAAGSDGHVWGGGGGGGGGGSSAGPGGAGGRGQVSVTYTAGHTLVASISPTAGTDQYGNNYPQGVGGIVSPLNVQGNTESISFTNQTSWTQPITFARPYANPPIMSTNIASGAGAAAHWDSRADAITNTGFTLFVYSYPGGAAQTWSAIPVQWRAEGT